MSDSPYVPLRIQSSYSMLEGAIHPKQIAEICTREGMPAAALVDRSVMFGAMEFSEILAASGVQPIIGVLLAVERPGGREIHGRPQLDWLALLAQDEGGYANLIKLVGRAHLDNDPADGAHISLDDLETASEGVIALTAGGEGAVARLLAEGQRRDAEAYLAQLERVFGDRLYVEISRTGDALETACETALVELAHARGLPLVATNPACFPDPEFAHAHDAMLCIADGTYIETAERRRTRPDCWLKPPAAMRELFADLPEALDNTALVARRCAVMAPARAPILPNLAGDREGEAAQLRKQARAGLEARLEGRDDADRAAYFERLDYELDIIAGMGFAGYFLIVADFIQWAKGEGIPVGPGRGSGAGSVVAWALTITDLDPIRLGLLFERFLNPERVSMPDFDIDFCETRRGEVIRYVQQRYGREQVAQIITFGKLKARAVLKDVGRVLQMPYGQIDKLAKLVPNNPADPWDLKRTLNGVSEFVHERDNDEDVRRLVDLALKLEGMPRHSSTHAAGVVIGDRPLGELVPLYRDPRSDMPVTQFDMKWVERAGLVKFDFLGLKTLSVLQRAVELIAQGGETFELDRIPWDDAAVYELMARGDTVGVFQLESEGMRRTLAQVKPDKFEDIVALVSLYRPGPMDNIPQFARRKHGLEKPDYLHPRLEKYLSETYGVIIYQEQVMQIAQELAGYSLGEADLLRRAMGKKKPAEMAKQKSRFLEGAAASGVDPRQADRIFELVAKFAGYGFNKSHAAAYALVAYQTAYLKTHHPTEFYAASMAFDIHLTDKLSLFMEDMKRTGVECLPPDINVSDADFTIEEGNVRYALAALKSVGMKAMQAVVQERKANGLFRSIDDFAARVDPQLLNKRQIETLAAAGAFDALEPNRAAVHAMADSIMAAASAAAEARITQQGALFGGAKGSGQVALMPPKNVADWTRSEAMAHEREAFGFFFSSHPLSAWQHLLGARNVRSYGALVDAGRSPGDDRMTVPMAVLVESTRWRTPQRGGDKYILANVSDESAQFMASAFNAEAQALLQEAAKSGECLLVEAELKWAADSDQPRIAIRSASTLSSIGSRSHMRALIELSRRSTVSDVARLLPNGGRCEVILRVPMETGGTADITVGTAFTVDDDLLGRIGGIEGVKSTNFLSER